MSKLRPVIRKPDKNTPAILEVLYTLGFDVLNIHTLGKGYPDLLAVKEIDDKWRMILVEVKQPGGRLTPAEREFAEDHPGLVHVWHNAEEAILDLRKEQ